MTKCKKVHEATEVCKACDVWRSILSQLPLRGAGELSINEFACVIVFKFEEEPNNTILTYFSYVSIVTLGITETEDIDKFV